jgi:hypothetical protein
MATDTRFSPTIRNFSCEGTVTQYHFVKLNASYKVEECDSEGEAVFGIALETGSDEGRIDVFAGPGFCKVAAGNSTTVNGYLQCDSDGEAIDSATTGHDNVAIGLEAAGAADQIIECYFFGPGYLTEVGD